MSTPKPAHASEQGFDPCATMKSKLGITLVAVGCMSGLGFLVGYAIGYNTGADYGVATTHLVFEQTAVNRGYGNWAVESVDGKPTVIFQWKDCQAQKP